MKLQSECLINQRELACTGVTAGNVRTVNSRWGWWQVGECKTLRHLNLSYCDAVHEDAFVLISHHCNHLVIFIAAQTRIQDNALMIWGKRSCCDLQQLWIPGCTSITTVGVLAVSHSKSLLTLSIVDCPQIDRMGLEGLPTSIKLRV